MEILEVVFSVTFYSDGGKSIYRELGELNRDTFKDYIPKQEGIEEAVHFFLAKGCIVEARSEVGITVSCEKEIFEEIFTTEIVYNRIKYIKDFDKYIYENKKEIIIPKELKQIERIILPKQSFELESKETQRPDLNYRHLNVPEDIAAIANAGTLHDNGYFGQGIRVIMIDTGLYEHQYYKEKCISFNRIGAVNSFLVDKDERGHGTAMSSVLLSIAPKCDYTLVKSCNKINSYPIPALQKAVGLVPDVINCSWGIIGYEPQIYLEIANAVSKNIIMVYSSGNGSSDRKNAFFQSIAYPDVISVGGCFVNANMELELSDISSGYKSELFDARCVPDLCGICGKMPKAQLILMPTQPGCIFDVSNGKRDGTGQEDGWMVSSGTSAAAAYVTGLIALYLQLHPDIDRRNLKEVLKTQCNPINKGINYMGYPAETDWNNCSCGSGFLTAKNFGI